MILFEKHKTRLKLLKLQNIKENVVVIVFQNISVKVL